MSVLLHSGAHRIVVAVAAYAHGRSVTVSSRRGYYYSWTDRSIGQSPRHGHEEIVRPTAARTAQGTACQIYRPRKVNGREKVRCDLSESAETVYLPNMSYVKIVLDARNVTSTWYRNITSSCGKKTTSRPLGRSVWRASITTSCSKNIAFATWVCIKPPRQVV